MRGCVQTVQDHSFSTKTTEDTPYYTHIICHIIKALITRLCRLGVEQETHKVDQTHDNNM